MTGFHLVILFGLSYVLVIPCEGKITSPPDGTELTILPGSSKTITWAFGDNPSEVTSRSWYFTSYDRLVREELIAVINVFGKNVRKNILPRLNLTEPATLSLSNVSQSYDGTYELRLEVKNKQPAASRVIVYIAKKPNVTFNCSRRNEVNEGGDFTCVCRGEGGRPPASVTWSKDGKKIGAIGKENQTLTFSNVDGKASGTYECKAESYPSDEYIDEKSIVVEVNSKPYDTNITLTPGRIIEVGGSVTITCKVHGFPIPSYNITHNVTKIVSINKTHTIEKVKWSDAGTYKCIAKNKFGSDSDFANLTIGPITPTPTISTPRTSQAASSPTSSSATVGPTPTPTTPPPLPTGAIIGIIVGVLVLIIIVVVVVYCYKSKQKERGNRANIDPVPGNHYELENEEPGPGDGAYDTVGPVGASGSKSKPPAGNTLPPVYAAVDKNNRQGNTLYASLDTDAMQSSRASKKEPDRPPQTEYASIDFKKSAPKADLV